MKASPEFEKFASFFIQDLDDFLPDYERMYGFVLTSVKGVERTKLRDFLDLATQDTVSDHELMGLWKSVNDEVQFFTADGLRMVLKGARDRL